MPRSSTPSAVDGVEVFYDEYGREFRATTPDEKANARFAWGYSTEKPKGTADLPEEPVGDPGPASGAVTP
jgi:hypothetical protein